MIEDKYNTHFNPRVNNMIDILNNNMKELRRVKGLKGKMDAQDVNMMDQVEREIFEV